jgi:hypothetical protein
MNIYYVFTPCVLSPQVPSSYVALQQKVAEEVMRCREKEVPPVLNQKEFAALAESIEDGDINDPEELSLGKYSGYTYMYETGEYKLVYRYARAQIMHYFTCIPVH